MPLGIVSDKDFEREKSNLIPDNTTSINGEVVVIERGRGKGNTNVPNSLRKIIGETNELDGRQEAIEFANKFGISPSSVSAYANGSTSTATYDKTPNQAHITSAMQRISRRARGRLMRSLSHLTEDKLRDASAKDLATIAKSMSGIVKEMEPEVPKTPDGALTGKPSIVLFAPTFVNENIFDVVVAKE